jgi:CheY-like chemotaxis protein
MANPIILIVENEALIRISASHIVEDAGFSALQACDADEAIRVLAQRNDIRAVFTDINMKGSSEGLKLAHAIRGRWPPIHVILASGPNGPDKALLPAEARLIRKPYAAQHVLAVLRELFGLKRAPFASRALAAVL